MTSFPSMAGCLAAALVATGLAMALPAGAQTVSEQRKAADDWFDYEIRWTEGAPSYTAKWMVFTDSAGKMVVCGVGAHSGGKRLNNRKILKDLGLHLGEDLIDVDMSFFAEVKGSKTLVGTSANCVPTNKKLTDYRARSVSLRATRPHRRY